MGRPLRQLGQPQISAGEPGSEPETYGTGLCGYFLSPQNGSGDTAWGDNGSSGNSCLSGKGTLCRTFKLWWRDFGTGSSDPERSEMPVCDQSELLFYIWQNSRKEWIKGYDRQSEKRTHYIQSSGTGTVDGPLSQWDPGRQPYSKGRKIFERKYSYRRAYGTDS